MTPLATAALMIGANAPDIDVVANFAGDYSALAHRRGWTHGVLAIAVLPFVVAGGLLLWDRRAQRRRRADIERARAGPLLALAALAVVTHPTLDWLNNYGMRWLMPFDDRWFYGDALFIVDPWIWLLLGGVLFLAYSRRFASLAAWSAFWLFGSLLIFATSVPDLARAVWAAGVVGLIAARAANMTSDAHPLRLEHATRAALVLVGAYVSATVIANVPARAEVHATLASLGVNDVQDVMIGPSPADPFAGTVIAETPTAYYKGRWHWLETPRFEPAAEPIVKLERSPVVDAATRTVEARRYLTWSRFPYFEIESDGSGHVVRILDARYEGAGRLGGVVVRLDPDLRPIAGR